MSAKIMLVSSNYAKNYASTIYIIILARLLLLGDIVFRPECCDPICRCLFTCLFRDVHLYIIVGARFSMSQKVSLSASYAISYFSSIFFL